MSLNPTVPHQFFDAPGFMFEKTGKQNTNKPIICNVPFGSPRATSYIASEFELRRALFVNPPATIQSQPGSRGGLPVISRKAVHPNLRSRISP